jgi:hypothetical protein
LSDLPKVFPLADNEAVPRNTSPVNLDIEREAEIQSNDPESAAKVNNRGTVSLPFQMIKIAKIVK